LIIKDIVVLGRRIKPKSAMVSNLTRARSSKSLPKPALTAAVATVGGIEECPCKAQIKEIPAQNRRGLA
jgi:hypothetical protein